MEANTFGLRVQQLSQSMRSISCTLFLLAVYPWLGQLQRQDCSSPSSLVCDSSIVKPALEKSSNVTIAPGKQHLRQGHTTAVESRELPSHYNRASLNIWKPQQEHIEQHPGAASSKTVMIFRSSGGSRQGVYYYNRELE